MSQGTSRRRKTSIGEVLAKSRDYRLEQMKLELYDMPKAFFQDDVAQDYYDTAKKLINEKHESAELMFTELKEMITSGYRTGKKDGDREEGWNTKTNQYEFRTPQEWARMQKRRGSPKVKEERPDTTVDKGTDEVQPGGSVGTTTTEGPQEKVEVEGSSSKPSWPIEEVEKLLPPQLLSDIKSAGTETSTDNLSAKGMGELEKIIERLTLMAGKIYDVNDKIESDSKNKEKEKQSESLINLANRITERLIEVDAEYRKLKTLDMIEGTKKERTTGKITFTKFPNLKVPEHDATAMPGVSYLEAVINDANYRIYAGQNYLNTEYSQECYDTPPAKGGSIIVYQGGSRFPDTDDYKCIVVGDAHHRFVWGAHHKQAIVAQFEPKPFVLAIEEWSNITYKHNPKHEYSFDVSETNDPLKANANSSVKKKLFLAAVSPLPAYSGKYAKSPEDFIQTHLAIFWKEIQKGIVLEEKELKKLKKYLDDLVDTANARRFDIAVKDLVKGAKNKELAEAMGSMLLESMSGNLPNVALGATPSVGYYDPKYNVIVLDPIKNATPDAQLDTLSFETGNAKRRDAFLDKENSKTNTEFGTMNDYVKILLTASKSSDIDQLVEYLNIPKEYLEPAVAAEILKMKQPALPMPDKTVMPEQKFRSALAWWKMKHWKEEERLQYFSKSAHAEGMGATGSEYKS